MLALETNIRISLDKNNAKHVRMGCKVPVPVIMAKTINAELTVSLDNLKMSRINVKIVRLDPIHKTVSDAGPALTFHIHKKVVNHALNVQTIKSPTNITQVVFLVTNSSNS